MTLRKIKFYDVSRRIDMKPGFDNDISKLNEIAKTDFFFIGSILGILSNWSYHFINNDKRYKNYIKNYYLRFHDFFNPVILFGTGFISKLNKSENYIRNIKILAVRGKLTLQRLLKNGVKTPKSVILADPGILFPFIFNMSQINSTKKIYRLCIIPHYVDKENSLIKNNIKVNNSFILDINDNPDKFVKSLLKCERVLSSSLHGLIISDSLGIANMRMIVSSKIKGGDYKFKDYYSAYDLELPFYIDLRSTIVKENNLNIIDSSYKISLEMIRKKQCLLLINFPYRLRKQFENLKNKQKKY